MFFANNMSLPTWAWVVIATLTIIGVVLGGWSFFSGVKIFSKSLTKREKTKNPLVGSKEINLNQIEEYKGVIGVVGFVINTKTDEYFKPIFVDTTKDISKWVFDIKTEIINNNTKLAKQVNSWLEEKEYKIDRINFVCVSKTETLDAAIKWKETLLDELKLKQRMFER